MCSATASTTSRCWRSRSPSASSSTTPSCSWKTPCAGWRPARRALEATLNGAKEISFTILSMTLSLAAVFIPLVFMPGLIGRSSSEFAITIIVAILASGVVSLTLTPLMCARMLARHESGHKDLGGAAVEHDHARSRGQPLRPLAPFFPRAQMDFRSGVGRFAWRARWCFSRPCRNRSCRTGDSGFHSRHLQAQEGTSPERMRAIPDARWTRFCERSRREHAACTVSGLTGRTLASQALVLGFLKPAERAPVHRCGDGRLMQEMSQIPGMMPFLQANPVLQISTGATATIQGKFAYAVSGDRRRGSQRCRARTRRESCAPIPASFSSTPTCKLNTPNLQIDILREQASTYGVSRQAHPQRAPQRLRAELRLSHQETDRPIPGDHGSEG